MFDLKPEESPLAPVVEKTAREHILDILRNPKAAETDEIREIHVATTPIHDFHFHFERVESLDQENQTLTTFANRKMHFSEVWALWYMTSTHFGKVIL